MNKISALVLGTVLVLSSGLVFAHEGHDEGKETLAGKSHESIKDMHQMGGPGEHGMMGMMMGRRTVVATSDGGVVVVDGDHLTKFDKNLKLVNQAEIKHVCPDCAKAKDGKCAKCAAKKDGKECPMKKDEKGAQCLLGKHDKKSGDKDEPKEDKR